MNGNPLDSAPSSRPVANGAHVRSAVEPERAEVAVRLTAARDWIDHALAGDCPLELAVEAVADLAMAARLHLDQEAA